MCDVEIWQAQRKIATSNAALALVTLTSIANYHTFTPLGWWYQQQGAGMTMAQVKKKRRALASDQLLVGLPWLAGSLALLSMVCVLSPSTSSAIPGFSGNFFEPSAGTRSTVPE